jgi:hypothetical protein
VSGVQFLYDDIQYESLIVGKAVVTTFYPIILPRKVLTIRHVSLGNFVPLVGAAAVFASVNGSQSKVVNQVLISSRLSTMVSFQLIQKGPFMLNLSFWNSLLPPSRSADISIFVEGPQPPS